MTPEMLRDLCDLLARLERDGTGPGARAHADHLRRRYAKWLHEDSTRNDKPIEVAS